MTGAEDGRSLPLPSLRVTIVELEQNQRSNRLSEPLSARQHPLIELNGLPIGLASYELDGERLLIHELAVAAEHRDRGYGAEAVFTIETLSGAAESYALVPLANGLAVYFWLRIGYRPRFRSRPEWLGYTVMVRDLRDGGVPQAASGAAR